MDSINDANRHSVTSQKDILSVQRSYFSDLYKKKVSRVNMTAKIDYFMKDTSIPHISEEQRKSCEGALSESEVPSVLKQMKTGSAPGSDGITFDFLKVFGHTLVNLLQLRLILRLKIAKCRHRSEKRLLLLFIKVKNYHEMN